MEIENKSSLDKSKLYAEDAHPKHYISPDLGKKKPWIVRTFKTAKNAVVGFVLDIIAAIKEITRKVM